MLTTPMSFCKRCNGTEGEGQLSTVRMKKNVNTASPAAVIAHKAQKVFGLVSRSMTRLCWWNTIPAVRIILPEKRHQPRYRPTMTMKMIPIHTAYLSLL